MRIFPAKIRHSFHTTDKNGRKKREDIKRASSGEHFCLYFYISIHLHFFCFAWMAEREPFLGFLHFLRQKTCKRGVACRIFAANLVECAPFMFARTSCARVKNGCARRTKKIFSTGIFANFIRELFFYSLWLEILGGYLLRKFLFLLEELEISGEASRFLRVSE